MQLSLQGLKQNSVCCGVRNVVGRMCIGWATRGQGQVCVMQAEVSG